MRDDTIVAVGTVAEIKAYIGSKTEVIDLAGRFAMPAFIDSHAHFMGVGEAKLNLELMKVRNWDEIVAMVADAAKQGEAGRVDSRAGLAPGEVGPRAGRRRRGVPDPRRC